MSKLVYKLCPNPRCGNYGWEQLTDAKTCDGCGRRLESVVEAEG